MLHFAGANVSISRIKQFALIQPSTRSRLDVGINLKGMPAAGSIRLIQFHDLAQVRVESMADVNKELIAWLK